MITIPSYGGSAWMERTLFDWLWDPCSTDALLSGREVGGLLYSAMGPQGWNVLWRVQIEGGRPVQLNDDIGEKPAISPDGTKIAAFYGNPREGRQALSKVAIIPASGGAPIRVFPLPPSADQRASPRWTPEGDGIAYVDAREPGSNIWVQPVDGGPPRPLTHFSSSRVVSFDWSWDGRQLAVSLGAMPHDMVLIEDRR